MASEPKGNILIPVWVDAGVVKALVSDAGTIPTTESTPLTSIDALGHGYDGTDWRKHNLLWGYYDRLAEKKQYTMDEDASYGITLFTVPPGYVYVVTATMSLCMGNAIRHDHVLTDGSSWFYVARYDAQEDSLWAINAPVHYPMKEGDKYIGWFTDALDTDVLFARVWGYKMKINM